ncbi:MAG: GWxTD domain-containing protein [Ignavibacteria bacterium]|nr:GWxTD domain-containing protein [Ignavibacteria bacterium]
MIMKLVQSLFLFLIIFHTNCVSQEHQFRTDVDFASFRFDDSLSYVEIFVSVPSKCITYATKEKKLLGEVQFSLTILKNDSTITSKQWILQHTKEDSSESEMDKSLVDIAGFVLPSGNYSLRVVAFDFHSPSEKNSFEIPLLVTPYSQTHTLLSDIELCTTIIKASEEEKLSSFYKNSYLVAPNTRRLYGQGLPVLYYFVECYNLLSEHSLQEYQFVVSVTNTINEEIIHHSKKKTRSVNHTAEVGTLNVSNLRSGTYTLNISLFDTTVFATTSKKFFVFNPILGADTILQMKLREKLFTEFASFTEQELDELFHQATYIATENEREQFQKLQTSEAKRNFLTEFWEQRTITTSEGTSSLKKEYERRIEYTNKNFSTATTTNFPTLGWKTDKGRVYILYGAPNEIKHRPNSTNLCPFEIWDYHQLQGGVSFYFIDEFNSNQWRLVHSNARSEILNLRWKEKIESAE